MMSSQRKKPFKRILLKISGEVLCGQGSHGFDKTILSNLAHTLKKLHDLKIEICLVVGGGNFFRGAQNCDELISRVGADTIGMMATVMNGVALQDALGSIGLPSVLVSNKSYGDAVQGFNAHQHQEDVSSGKIVIFVGGLGIPFLTTDTCGVIRALEMTCDCLFKATKYPGIYDKDPAQNPEAKHFATLSYDDAIKYQLKAMDQTAFVLAKENSLELIVFSLFPIENIVKIIQDDPTVQYTHMN
jgi:uridylate kinase